MSKCEWKDGKFVICKPALGLLNERLNDCKRSDFDFTASIRGKKGFLIMGDQCFSFCPFCGANIIKPEPEVIIKKSGGTWVARYDGVDYLWIGTPEKYAEYVYLSTFPNQWWVPISEIKITDEIALLRPMTVSDSDEEMKARLYGVHQAVSIVYHCNGNRTNSPSREYTSNLRIATVDDL